MDLNLLTPVSSSLPPGLAADPALPIVFYVYITQLNGPGREILVTNSETKDGLAMTPEEIRQMGRMAVETLVERISTLGETGAWDGEFR